MEGYNPTLGCAMGCFSSRRSWVPFPRTIFPRRDALVDAVGRTDNPCERPARCGPCCEPMPKFRRPKEKPECNICCYLEEQKEAKRKEACEEYQKFVKECCPPCCPEMIIEPLDPQNPIAVELPEDIPPEERCILKELPCRTNIIAGFFNPEDNKSTEQKLKEKCDQTYLSCGPNLPMYPCHGVIEYPRVGWTTVGEEMRRCQQIICEGTKYCDTQYIQEQIEVKRQKALERQMETQRQAMADEIQNNFLNPNQPHPCCANQKLSLTPYCNCGCDVSY